jgi:hypothetical protein
VFPIFIKITPHLKKFGGKSICVNNKIKRQASRLSAKKRRYSQKDTIFLKR